MDVAVVKRQLDALQQRVLKYSPDQLRDNHGRWTDGGASYPDRPVTAEELLRQHEKPGETIQDVYDRVTPDQRAAIVDAEAANSRGVSTKAPVSQGGFIQSDGTYTPERQDLHRRILQDMFTKERVAAARPSPQASEKPTLYMTGGRPAAGKTSALKAGGIDFGRAMYISADEIQEKLPGYNGKVAGLYNPEAQDIAAQAETIGRRLGVNMVYDATMKTTQSALERADEYKKAGYDVEGYFIHTSPATSAYRSVERFTRTGRYVPPEVSFNSRTNEKTFDALTPKLKRWALFDNNGAKPRLVSRGGSW